MSALKIFALENWLLLPLLLTGGAAEVSASLGFNTLSQSASTLEIAVVVSAISRQPKQKSQWQISGQKQV